MTFQVPNLQNANEKAVCTKVEEVNDEREAGN